ncbi:MAG: GNAT family N-acetyltransferase [Polyangia bacterium]
MPFTVRPITAPDVDAVVRLVSATLAEFGLTFGVGSSTDDEVRALPGSYTERGGAFFVAVDESGAVFGTAGVSPVAPQVFELRKMYLVPAARGLGLGARLFDACLAFCRAHSARHVVLDTIDGMKDAIAFYERRGFVQDDSQIRGARCTRGYRLDL